MTKQKGYPGLQELQTYVSTTKHPGFDAFVGANKENLSAWSMELPACTEKELFETWSIRFTYEMKQLRPHFKTKKLTRKEGSWDEVSKLLNARRTANLNATVNGFRVVERYTERAANALINDSNQMGPSTQEEANLGTINSKEQADTESDVKICLNPNIQKKRKIDVHDDDQNSDQANNDDQTNHISSTDANRPLEEETTDGKINQLIFGMGFKKLANIPWNDTEKIILAQLKESLFLDVNMVLAPLIVQMLTTESKLEANDLRFLKLCLSGIVNLMNTSQWNRVKTFLPQQKFPQLDELITSFKCHGMKDDSLKLFQDIATVCTSGESEDVLLAIDEFKKPLLRAKKTDQEAYRMLKILEHVVESMGDFDTNESESTSYRRIAIIMDYLFRGTKVKCMDGELTSNATKSVRMYNDAILNIKSTDLRGKKIDLLMKYGSSQGIELSSNEFKTPRPTPSVALQQQCKNLRTNAAIFNSIRALNPRKPFTRVVAMDWLGSVGYIYLMTDIDGLYYAKNVGILSLPKSLNDMADFESTLDLLFCYRREMLYSGSQAAAALAKRQDFEQLCELVDTAKEFSPMPHHNIYFTPTQQRTKTMRSNP